MASVKVAVRVRPLNKRELQRNAKTIVQVDGNKTRILGPKTPGSRRNFGKSKHKDFTFDHSYWSCDLDDDNYAPQEEIFHDLGVDVINSAFEGYNACVFAYGQTGSGKTYTMMGTPESQGLIPRICKGLFARMAAGKESGTSYRTEVSFLEIYNEKVRDLLKPNSENPLRVRESPETGPHVENLSSHLVYDYSDIQECMLKGNTQRTTASTKMNDTSSRSHAIFTITFVQASLSESDMPSETVSKVHLVDLAGSERATTTGTSGKRLKEGGHINKSLVTLGSVISTLGKNKFGKETVKRNQFVPYRDSVLTWLLKDSLGGNSKTIMIATISPADCHRGETISTLRYAHRAKRIVNQPKINEDANVRVIRALREEIQRLKSLLNKDMDVESPQQKLLEQIHAKQEREKVLTEEWTEKWKETQQILQEQKALGLRKSGAGVILDSEMPHLVGIDDNLLSTGVTLYHLKEGKTLVGTEKAPILQDIVLTGSDVESEHCIVELNDGVATLHPFSLHCWINTALVDKPTKLSQGCIILLGRNNMFRYNDPIEAAKLRKEGGANDGKLQSTVINISRLSLQSCSASDLHVSSSSDNTNSSEEFRSTVEELEQQKAALLKEKEDFKREQEEQEEKWAARKEALEEAHRELTQEWSAQWKEWANAIAILDSRQKELRARRSLLEQERRDEMTQVENMCKDINLLRTTLQSKHEEFQEYMKTHELGQIPLHQLEKTDNDAVSDGSLPESWSSFSDEKYIDVIRELVNNHKKEIAALESELQSKVKFLNEHQMKLSKMEKELTEIAQKQNENILDFNLIEDKTMEKKIYLAKRTQEQLQEIFRRKQSLSLNLKRVLPTSCCDQSSSDEEMTSYDLNSLHEITNRKYEVASSLMLESIPSSVDTIETFHTAAANSPEPCMPLENAATKSPNDFISNEFKELKEDKDEYCLTDNSPKLENKNNINVDKAPFMEQLNDEMKEVNSLILPTMQNNMFQDLLESPIEQNPAMKKLNQKIAHQRIMVMRCLEINTPSKEDLNQQITILQNLQKQQIELEVSLLKNEREHCEQYQYINDNSESENNVQNEPDTYCNTNNTSTIPSKTTSSEVFSNNRPNNHEMSELLLSRMSSSRDYSTVYLTSQNRGDRLSSPYSLTIARSLPSLISNNSDCNSIINLIVSVPSYVIRGAGASSHYEYEVRIVVKDDSWTLLRRYRRFRELYIAMRQIYSSKVAAIHFPPRQVFPKYEVVAKQRRKRLEDYLRQLIQTCSQLPQCKPLYKYNGNLNNIDKQSLLEFSSFFKRGMFESSKYSTS